MSGEPDHPLEWVACSRKIQFSQGKLSGSGGIEGREEGNRIESAGHGLVL